MAHAWARDMRPIYSMVISPIQQTTHSWTKMLYGCPSVRLDQSAATVHPSQPNTEESDNLVDELIEDMADGSFLSTGNDDWKEAAWQRKLRKLSKVNIRRRKH